jgi:HK97 gp10 family phage protein
MKKRPKIKGLEKLKQALKKVNSKASIDTKFEVARGLSQIELSAKTIVPVDLGKLKQSIKTEIEPSGFRGKVNATEDYAPYIEFGTGQFVKVPDGFEKMAMEFYVNGQGRTRPRPFLIPSWAKELPVFKRNLEKIVKNLSW